MVKSGLLESGVVHCWGLVKSTWVYLNLMNLTNVILAYWVISYSPRSKKDIHGYPGSILCAFYLRLDRYLVWVQHFAYFFGNAKYLSADEKCPYL